MFAVTNSASTTDTRHPLESYLCWLQLAQVWYGFRELARGHYGQTSGILQVRDHAHLQQANPQMHATNLHMHDAEVCWSCRSGTLAHVDFVNQFSSTAAAEGQDMQAYSGGPSRPSHGRSHSGGTRGRGRKKTTRKKQSRKQKAPKEGGRWVTEHNGGGNVKVRPQAVLSAC